MNKNRIKNLKKDIKDSLNQYISAIDDDVILTGTLLRATEQSVRLQVYLELEAEHDNKPR